MLLVLVWASGVCSKPQSCKVFHPGYLKLSETFWVKNLAEEYPAAGKHEVHFNNAAGYWGQLSKVAFSMALGMETV